MEPILYPSRSSAAGHHCNLGEPCLLCKTAPNERDHLLPSLTNDYKGCTLLAHCLHTACTLLAHCLHTACTLLAHCLHTACTLLARFNPESSLSSRSKVSGYSTSRKHITGLSAVGEISCRAHRQRWVAKFRTAMPREVAAAFQLGEDADTSLNPLRSEYAAIF